jgi:hypothetical protein
MARRGAAVFSNAAARPIAGCAIGRAGVVFTSDSATVELISWMPGSFDSLVKKKRS